MADLAHLEAVSHKVNYCFISTPTRKRPRNGKDDNIKKIKIKRTWIDLTQDKD